jgi:flagellar hook-associated protein 1 FlgK
MDISGYFGLNDVLTDTSSAATIAIRSDLLSAPDSLPTGTLATDLAIGDTAVGVSDATIAEALSDALTGKTSFAASGWLGGTKATFTSYAASIISSVATRADAASDAASSVDATLSTLQSRFSNQSGVNVDAESAKLSDLQSAYAASAQVLSAVQAMFDSLLNAVSR